MKPTQIITSLFCLSLLYISPALANVRTKRVPVLTEAIEKGSIIKADDLIYKDLRLIRANGALAKKQIVGRMARRMLYPNSIVRAFDVKAPDVVRKGQMVSLIYKSGALTIATTGRVLENGEKGSMVRVENLTSKKTVTGQATSGSIVLIQGANLNSLSNHR